MSFDFTPDFKKQGLICRDMYKRNGTCEYVLDPDDHETWVGEERDECYVGEELLNEDGVWTCPHDAEEGENLCIFHLPVEEKNDEVVVNSFVNKLNQASGSDDYETQERKLEFLGARFGKFELDNCTINIVLDCGQLVMDHSIIRGELKWSNSVFNIPSISLRSIRCVDNANFNSVEFRGEADFTRAEFSSKANFNSAKFDCESEFSKADFEDIVQFWRTEFGGNTDFSGAVFNSSSGFFGAEFCGDAKFNHVTSHVTIDFKRADFSGKTEFTEATFEGESNFRDANFMSTSKFYSTEFRNESYFNRVEFSEVADFNEPYFGGDVEFEESKFQSETYFVGAEFNTKADFSGVVFRGNTDFISSEFNGKALFNGTEFENSTDFREVEFNFESSFTGTIFGDNTDFRGAEFGDKTRFLDAEFGAKTNFESVVFEKGADFYDLDLEATQFANADLTDVEFTQTKLSDASFESALLSRSTLFGADLRGAKLNGAVLGDVRINEDTQFLGHPDDDSDYSPHTFSAIRSKPCCVYDPNYVVDNEEADIDKAKSVYRALEELAAKAARTRLQSQCFVRRQDLQKDGYRQDTVEAESWQKRLIAGARYSRAKVARGTLLYGESPWRIIGGSIGFIILVSLFYPLGEWLRPVGGEGITYSRILGGEWSLLLESLYFSTLTFTTLGMGDYEPMGFGQVLATLNTAFGAVLIALLVFVLGRRAAR